MSVFDKLKAYSRKPAAVILATVMATSTIPTTPIAQAVTAAYAAETSTTQSAKGAEKKSYVDAAADFSGMTGTITLTNDAFSTTDFQSGEYTLKKADLEKWLLNNQSSQFKAAVKEAAQKAFSDEVLKIQKDNNDAEINIISPTEDDLNALPAGLKIDKVEVESVEAVPGTDNLVCESAGADAWTIKSKGEVDNGALKVKIKSVSFSGGEVKYQVADSMGFPEDETAEPSEEGTKKEPETKTASVSGKTGEFESTDNAIKVSAHDAWNGQADKLNTAAAEEVSDLVYKEDAKSVSLFAAAPIAGFKADQEKYTDEDGCFEATVDSNTYQVTVKPLKASNKHKDSPSSFVINWTYPNGKGTGKSTKVIVNPVARKTVTVSLPGEKDGAYTYRLKDAEQNVVMKSANEAIKSQIKSAFGDDLKADLFKSVSIDGMKADGGDAAITLDYAEGVLDKEYSNYQFERPTTVKVAAVENVDWKDTGITAYSDNGGDCSSLTESQYSTGKWLNGTNGSNTPVTFAWKSHKLAIDAPEDGSGEKFTETVDPKVTADGDFKSGITFFAVDGDGVVTKTTDVKFRRDTAAPVLETTELVSGFKTRNQKVHGSLAAKAKFVTDKLALNAFVVDPNGENASGLSSDPTVSYTYGKNSKSAGNENNGSGSLVSKKGNSFTYDLSGNSADQKVFAGNIKVSATDVAGNKMEKAVTEAKGQLKIAELELIQNASKPTVTAGFDNNNVQREANGRGYYNANRTFTITVTDSFGDYVREYDSDQVIATITDGNDTFNVTPHDLTDMGNDTYTFSYTFGAKGDADCKVSAVNYANLAGTTAAQTFFGDTFTIDKTAPKLNVSWNTEAAQNGKYYNAARTATITVEEHNFDPNLFKIEAPVSAGNGDEATPAQIGGWSSNGDTHTATVTFPGQGVYTLSVSGEDLASNKSESYTSPEFVIDTIKPKIDIQNVVNRTAYAGEVAPSAAVHDTNLADGTTIEVSKISYPLSKDDPNPYAGAAINTSATDKSVSYLNPAKTKGNDGVYTLTVQAIDLAGNTESEAVTWSVNRFGSTYVISDNTGKMLDQYLKSSKTTDVKVTEINPSGLDDNKTSVELTRDTKNTTLKSGDNYTTDSDTSSGWSEYNYTVSKSNYDKDGAYRVLFHSEDAAGNSSENTMEGKNAQKSGASAEINFAVDDTAPIASFVDLASNGKYEESSHKAKVSFEDNLKLSKAQIKVNGKTVATFTADQLEKSPIREFVLDGSSSKQDVTVVAWDAAGNKSKELKATGVLVTNDSFVLWMNNLPLMVGTIVAIVVVAGGIYMVVAKKRKENEEK